MGEKRGSLKTRDRREKPKIIFLVNEDFYFCSHRFDLARAAREDGFEVVVATRVNKHQKIIESEGFKVIPIGIQRGRQNPIQELRYIVELIRLYRREDPDITHHVAMKHVILGSIAARVSGVPAVVNSMTGLGYTFLATGWKAGLFRTFLKRVLRFALGHPRSRTIFQNPDDRNLFVKKRLLAEHDAVVIRGSGVNHKVFQPGPEPSGEPLVLLAGRMLWDKGIGEFIEASRHLKKMGVHGKLVLVGMTDPSNPAHISKNRLNSWIDEGVVEWWGHQEEMHQLWLKASLAVLPSYREGLPKVLLEAASCQKPLVASDVPGCREIVQDGEDSIGRGAGQPV